MNPSLLFFSFLFLNGFPAATDYDHRPEALLAFFPTTQTGFTVLGLPPVIHKKQFFKIGLPSRHQRLPRFFQIMSYPKISAN
jgi:hypothetical protein